MKLWTLSRFFFCSGCRPGPHLALGVTSSHVTPTSVWLPVFLVSHDLDTSSVHWSGILLDVP